MQRSIFLRLLSRLKGVAQIGAVTFALATSFAVFAQSAPPAATPENPSLASFRPHDADMSVWLLKSIFGNWEGTEQIPMLGVAMQQLNIFALAFGTLMFTMVAVVGTLNSAQDGEVLGKKWSSTWVPLRFILGTGLMVPLTTGYSTAQHGILWLALMGSGGASTLWSAALTNFTGTQAAAAVQSPTYQRELEILFKGLLRAEVCMATLSQAEGIPYGLTSTSTSTDGTYGTKISYGQTTAGSQRDHCGSVTTLRYDAPADANGDYQLRSANNKALGLSGGGIDGAGGKPVKDSSSTSNAMKRLIDAQRDILVLITSGPLRQAAAQIAAKNPPSTGGAPAAPMNLTPEAQRAAVSAAMRQATDLYTRAMVGPTTAAISSIKGDLDSFIEDSRELGWVMSGATFFQMTAIRSKMNKAVKNLPEFSHEKWYASSLPADVAKKDLATDLDSLYARVEDGFAGDAASTMNPGDYLTKYFAKLFAFDPKSDSHALVQIKDTGDNMMVTGETIGLIAWVGNQVGESSGTGDVAGVLMASNPVTAVLKVVGKSLLQLGAPLLFILAAALFFSGVTMSLILPTLPFLMSVGAVLGWLMAVFSAVVAAPIWLAGHLNPDGDGFAGQRAAGGYMILLETATRPIFIVLGLIGAFLIMDPVCRFASLAFDATVNSLQGNSVTGLPSMVVLVCLYVVITWTIVRTSLTFTYDLAQKVYSWIGGQFSGYEKAQEFSSAAQSASQASERGMKEANVGLAAVSLVTAKGPKGRREDSDRHS